MGDDEAFLKAIAADPGGDAVRLIYADWLDERGDSRAAYLRVACAAAERIGDGLPWSDHEPALGPSCEAAPEEWRGRAGPWFDVVLDGFAPEQRPVMVHVVGRMLAKPLREARDLIDSAPAVVARRLTLERAEAARLELVFGFPLLGGPPPGERPICRASLRRSLPESAG